MKNTNKPAAREITIRGRSVTVRGNCLKLVELAASQLKVKPEAFIELALYNELRADAMKTVERLDAQIQAKLKAA